MKSEKPKKIKRIHSMKTLVWQWFIIFAAIIIIVAALVIYFIMSATFLTSASTRISEIGSEVLAAVDGKPVDETEATSLINGYAVSDGIDVYIVDLDGEVLQPSGFVPTENWQKVADALKERLGDWESGKQITYNQGGTLSFAACLSYGGRQCRMLVRYPVAMTAVAVARIELYLLIVAIGALALSFLLAYTIAKKLTRPIHNMSDTAAQLAKGNYSVQFLSAEYRELAQLSDTLNYAKDEIKKTDEFQKELLANVSHDLRTPLTMIKAYASMIQEISGNDPEKRNKHLQVIIDESDRLTGLVNDILDVSKISSGLEQLNVKVFNLTEYLYGVINKFGYLQETQGYSFMVDITPNLYTNADEEKIGQVFYNLISNAVNYTGEDKHIYITLKYLPENNVVHFAVRDTGSGIPEEQLGDIWNRYYRASDVHLRPIKGTGLGLNIVKVILTEHGFNFGVNSNEGGSEFFVDFPCVSSTPEI